MKGKDLISIWKNFDEFIETANKYCNWLVLRNFEYLPNDFFGNDKDVDILCEDIDFFVQIMKLRKRSWGIGAYETIIENKIVPFDVRFLGDMYYDKLWQYKMLENKIYTKENVPRMNNEDYFYSLIYHSKIQKMNVKDIYKERLYSLSKSINLQKYEYASIENNLFIANILSTFMQKNSYVFTTPIDSNVPLNIVFFKLLSPNVKYVAKYKIPKKVLIMSYVPRIIFKLIPRNIKEILKSFFK
jgi:hypothetical protein